MKKILFVICLVAFSFSYGFNDKSTKNTEKQVNINSINSSIPVNFIIEFGLTPEENIKSEKNSIYFLDCIAIALAVFDAAAEEGHSAEECGELAMATYWTCAAFKKLGEAP